MTTKTNEFWARVKAEAPAVKAEFSIESGLPGMRYGEELVRAVATARNRAGKVVARAHGPTKAEAERTLIFQLTCERVRRILGLDDSTPLPPLP